MPAARTAENFEDRKRAILIEEMILRSGHTIESQAADYQISPLCLRQVMAGSMENAKTRQRLCSEFGVSFWPGMTPQPDLPGQDGLVIAKALWEAAARLRDARANPEKAEQCTEAVAALVTPELVEAFERQKFKAPLRLVGRIARVFGPYADLILKIKRDAKRPNRILIG